LKDWLKELWESLKTNFGTLVSDLPPIPQNQLLHSKYHVFSSSKKDLKTTTNNNNNSMNISTMNLIEVKRITKEDWEQDVREFVFDISDQRNSFEFSVGDAVQILPRNLKGNVDKLLDRLKLDPSLIIEKLEQRASQHHHHHQEEEEEEQQQQQQQHSHPISQIIHQTTIPFPLTLREVLDGYFDLQKPPTQYFFELISHFATAEHEKEKLQFFASPEGQDDLNWYSWKEKRTPLEVLIEFPSIQNIPLEYVFDLFPRIIARSFSISSSPRLRNNRIHLTVAIVKYKTPLKRNRFGLCSNYLASLPLNSKVNAWIRQTTPELSNLLRVMNQTKDGNFNRNTTPLIMIGPGTGCAIFHALLEDELFLKQTSQQQSHISLLQQNDRNLAFFFGCRQRSNDYLHGEFWEKMKTEGILSLFDVAFSRDPIPNRVSESTKMKLAKVYVQFLIPLYSKELFDLIVNKGAAIIVSGSANRMPIDVKEAFQNVLQKEGNMDEESAKSFIENMQKQNKYQEETWS